MTKFNPSNKDSLTYGECLDPIFKITDKADAMQYKKAYVEFTEKHIKENEPLSALQIVNSNIGYYAGYGSNEDRKRIEELFECSHPVFGAVKENGVPTGEEAFECGKSGKTLEAVRK